MQCGIAALFLIGAWIAGSMGTSSPITASWVAASRADDTPPSAAAPQSRSDQPEVTTTAPQMDAQVTQQPTGSAAGARRVVPLARKVDPVARNQPSGSEPSR
jgi:hypothetical protein